jgi:hypothetical protein
MAEHDTDVGPGQGTFRRVLLRFGDTSRRSSRIEKVRVRIPSAPPNTRSAGQSAILIEEEVAARSSQSRQGLGLGVGAHPYAMREAVHLLRPADRDRDPSGPVPCLGVVGHIDDRETTEVLLGLDERPVGEYGRTAVRVDAANDVDASRPPSLKMKTPATVISAQTNSPRFLLR